MEFRTMTEMALREMRRAVIEGDLPPGSRLIPQKLETEMGLGRVAIREAIRELVGSGLVDSFPNKGTYVAAPPSKEEIKLIFELRILLEGKLAYEATKKITKKDLDLMEELNLKINTKEIRVRNYFILNREFHLIFYNASGWKSVIKVINQLMDQVLLFRSILPSYECFEINDNHEFIEDHRRIIEAIKLEDPRKAQRAVIDNLSRGFAEISNISEKLQQVSIALKSREVFMPF